MKKIVIIAVLAILFVVISACGNKKRHNINLLSNLKMLSKNKKNYNMSWIIYI